MKTTHVVLILDRSGSMASSAEEAVNNYNDQVCAFKKMAEETVGTSEIKVSLVTFNENVTEHLWEVPAADLQLCKQGDFIADGWTAMLDGIGYSIEKMLETTDVQDDENSYLFVIITDGQENKSKHYVWTQGEVNKLPLNTMANGVLSMEKLSNKVLPLDEVMKPLEDSGRWTFSFMGCDKHYLTQAAKTLNVPMANVALWDNSNVNSASFGYQNSSKRIYAATMNLCRGASSVSNMYSDDSNCADFCSNAVNQTPAANDVPPPVGDSAVFSNGIQANWK